MNKCLTDEHISRLYSLGDREERNQRASEIVDYLKLTKPTNILELGCGCGELSRKLIDAGHTVTSTNNKAWTRFYQFAKQEQIYNDISFFDYDYNPTNWLENSKNFRILVRNTSQKYDLVIAQRFSMHMDFLVKDEYQNLITNLPVEAINDDDVYNAYMGLVKDLKQVCKKHAVIYIGFGPPFTTHKGCGSSKLLKYFYNSDFLGSVVLKFNVEDI